MDGHLQGPHQRRTRHKSGTGGGSPSTGVFACLPNKPGKYNQPPFVVVRENHRETLPGWRELLAHVKNEGMREVSIQRYKGLGEMNAEQLWETTMNIDTRTLLKVSLEDIVQSDEIFTTLMGEKSVAGRHRAKR